MFLHTDSHLHRFDSWRSKRGIGTNLIITLGILVILFTLGMAFFNFLRGEQRFSRRFYEREQMIYAAEAAVEETVLHLRQTMNMEEQPWYRHLREPTASMIGVPAVEQFSPVFAHKMCKETFQGGYHLDVKITLDQVASFIDDPAPDAIEKTAIMIITASVSVGNRTFSVETMREVKVVRLSPPFPLEKYSLWLWDKGKLDKDQWLGAGGSTVEPLVQQDKTIMNEDWQYYWHDATKRRFPLCIQKLSYYFRDVDEFASQCYYRDTFSLSGLMMIGASQPNTKLKIFGRVQGHGGIITRGVKVVVRHFKIDPSFLFSLADIGGNTITIKGFGNRLFEGLIYLPYGGLDADSTLSIKGFVYAKDWNYSSRNELQFDQERLDPPVYYATMAEQTIKWVSRGEIHASSGPAAHAASLHDN